MSLDLPPASAYVHCWTCGTARTAAETYTHRADNPVLQHPRCTTCDDVLLSRPKPTVAELGADRGPLEPAMSSPSAAPRFTPEQHDAATALDATELHYAACVAALDAATTARTEARAAFRASFHGGPVASPFPVLAELRDLRERSASASPATE